MKNMEGKRKSLPFMLRLIIEGRTSLWVLHGGEGRRGQNIRNVPRCPYKIKVNYMKTSSKSYRSVCNCIRFSPYGIHRLKHHRLKKWNQNQDCFCWTNALLSFHRQTWNFMSAWSNHILNNINIHVVVEVHSMVTVSCCTTVCRFLQTIRQI